jgi:heme/copper-type cytochrome/quinol oxidase subunit 1
MIMLWFEVYQTTEKGGNQTMYRRILWLDDLKEKFAPLESLFLVSSVLIAFGGLLIIAAIP